MLEKQVVYDQITILEDGQIMCREVTRILEDGVKISHTFHRQVFHPGQSMDRKDDPRLLAIVAVVHTPRVIADFQEAERQRRIN